MPPVTRKAKVTRATRRDEIAGRLFEIVERLLEEGSAFSEISVEQLITEAGIARSTFYVYFEDKGALMVDLMDRATQDIGAAASDWFELPATATRRCVGYPVAGLDVRSGFLPLGRAGWCLAQVGARRSNIGGVADPLRGHALISVGFTRANRYRLFTA